MLLLLSVLSCTGLAPNLILVVNPAVQYMAYEWLTQRHTALKRRRLGLPPAAAGSSSTRVKLGPGEVFLLGEPVLMMSTEGQQPVGQERQQGCSGTQPAHKLRASMRPRLLFLVAVWQVLLPRLLPLW